MLRLCPPGRRRFAQVFPGELEATFGGGEANVVSSLALLGARARYLTALPDHAIARTFGAFLGSLGVDASRILYTPRGRMGVYYAEMGSNMRGSQVIYDRDGSSVALLSPGDYDFASMLEGVSRLHLTGITPALSRAAFETTLALAEYADSHGIPVSLDLNFRKKLWNWEPSLSKSQLAERCMRPIASHADILIGNEEDAQDVFGISADGTSIEEGRLAIDGYARVAERLSEQFPQARLVAITLRESISADHNNWGGMLYDCASRQPHFAPLAADGTYAPYPIRSIVDRFGGGDSFCAGLLYALGTPELADPALAIRFAVAASALKHTIPGDINYTTRDEVLNLMRGSASGRVQR